MKCLLGAKDHAKSWGPVPLSPSNTDSAYVELMVQWVTQSRTRFPYLFSQNRPPARCCGQLRY